MMLDKAFGHGFNSRRLHQVRLIMEKEKTGESLDTLKKEIIIPSTADLIERNANS